MKSFGERALWRKIRLSRQTFSVLLAIAGASMVTAGVWMIFVPAGWIVGGVIVLLFQFGLDMSTTSGGEGRSG